MLVFWMLVFTGLKRLRRAQLWEQPEPTPRCAARRTRFVNGASLSNSPCLTSIVLLTMASRIKCSFSDRRHCLTALTTFISGSPEAVSKLQESLLRCR